MSAALTIPAIPTMYRGVQYRSRLEARVAAFLDLLGWPFDYETIDLRGYVPDFIVPFDRPLLIEVKPGIAKVELLKYEPKIFRSGWTSDVLIVDSMLRPSSRAGLLSMGAYWQRANDGDQPPDKDLWFGPADAILIVCPWCEHKAIVHDDAAWFCSWCGKHDGDRIWGGPDGQFRDFWALAGNRTQWKGTTINA